MGWYPPIMFELHGELPCNSRYPVPALPSTFPEFIKSFYETGGWLVREFGSPCTRMWFLHGERELLGPIASEVMMVKEENESNDKSVSVLSKGTQRLLEGGNYRRLLVLVSFQFVYRYILIW